jgi:hypothetical protein
MGGPRTISMATASSDPADRYHEIELAPILEYDASEMTELDEALVTVMEQAVAAEESTLARLLRCEIGSLRYKAALSVGITQ